MMQQILIYSDSLIWGIIPESRNRLAFDQRWPEWIAGFGTSDRNAYTAGAGDFNAGVHLDADQHKPLGHALAEFVMKSTSL